MRLNRSILPINGHTHERAPAARMSNVEALRRTVMSCLLWEKEFYEDGEKVATRIERLAQEVTAQDLSSLALEARGRMHLRHVPLLLASIMSRLHPGNSLVADTVEGVIQRADELAELLVVHAKVNGVSPDKVKKHIPAQMKKGLARAFLKFNEYHLAKYDRAGAVRLRDVLFLSHAKPDSARREGMWERLINGDLVIPDTWETELSAGANKRLTFERLIRENKLGYMALLRNLRGMTGVGVNPGLVREAILSGVGSERVLPFRYIAAARAAPMFERELDQALIASVKANRKLEGTTVILVDVSGSMDSQLSDRSDLTRLDAAATLASIFPAKAARVFTFSDNLVEVPPRLGMAGVDCIKSSQNHSTTLLGKALRLIHEQVFHDRLVVITDEQSHDPIPSPVCDKAYMINVASAERGVGYGKWNHIDGFSENVIRWIIENERD